MAVRHFSFLAIWPSADRAAELGGQWQGHPARTSAFTALVAALLPGFARRPSGIEDQQKIAPVYLYRWESTLPLTLSLSDFEPKCFTRGRAGAAPNTISF